MITIQTIPLSLLKTKHKDLSGLYPCRRLLSGDGIFYPVVLLSGCYSFIPELDNIKVILR